MPADPVLALVSLHFSAIVFEFDEPGAPHCDPFGEMYEIGHHVIVQYQ